MPFLSLFSLEQKKKKKRIPKWISSNNLQKWGGMEKIRVLRVRTHLFSFRSRSLPAPPPPARPRERVASLEAASRIPRACLRPCPPDLQPRPPFPRALPTRGRSPPRYPRNPTSSPGQLLQVSRRGNTPGKNIRYIRQLLRKRIFSSSNFFPLSVSFISFRGGESFMNANFDAVIRTWLLRDDMGNNKVWRWISRMLGKEKKEKKLTIVNLKFKHLKIYRRFLSSSPRSFRKRRPQTPIISLERLAPIIFSARFHDGTWELIRSRQRRKRFADKARHVSDVSATAAENWAIRIHIRVGLRPRLRCSAFDIRILFEACMQPSSSPPLFQHPTRKNRGFDLLTSNPTPTSSLSASSLPSPPRLGETLCLRRPLIACHDDFSSSGNRREKKTRRG